MTSVSHPSLHPDVIARVTQLEFRARRLVEGLLKGRHRSKLFGHSVEFAQHREYVAGDDLRFIDWKAWAKSDRLYVKQFEEETNLQAMLVVDVSQSMNYGTGDEEKVQFACSLAAALSYLFLTQSDACGLVTFADQVVCEIEPKTSLTHFRTVLSSLNPTTRSDKTSLLEPIRRVAERQTRPGAVIVISDLFVERQSLRDGLRLLRERGHDVSVLHVLHRDELTFEFDGRTQFEGLEGQQRVACDPRALRRSYLDALESYLAELRQLAGWFGIDYHLVQSHQPLDAVLSALVRGRSRTR